MRKSKSKKTGEFVRDWGMYTRKGNRGVETIIKRFEKAAEEVKADHIHKNGKTMLAAENLALAIVKLSNKKGYEEVMDTVVREEVAIHLGSFGIHCTISGLSDGAIDCD